MNDAMMKETVVSKERIYDGKIIDVEKWIAELPNGKQALREIVLHRGASAIVPVDAEGNVYLVRQYRMPLQKISLEIPAGKLDSFAEDRLSAAKRELEEETGYTAKEWIDMGDYYPTPAYCDERITLYLARGLELGQRHLDEDEFLNFEAVPLVALVADVMEGRITDGKTQVAVLKAARMLGL